LRLHLARFPGDPVFDTALSHAMLRRVAAGTAPESLRLYLPENALLFSSLDRRRPGYARAVALAEEAGFPSVIRLAGGQAAAFLEQSVAFAWAIPDVDAHLHIRPRFEALTSWIVASLRKLGLDARVGELPGEYCPGEFSVNLEGRVKVMGVGQRVIRGGAHVGGVLTVGGSDELRATLRGVYDALGLEFRGESAGCISDFDSSLGVEDLLRAMHEVLIETGHDLESARFDESIVREAETLMPMHHPEPRDDRGNALRASRTHPKVVHHDDSD